MGRADHLVLGDWNVQCFECGRKMKASHAERNWQGYYVHPEHNEPRQTQDFVRGVPDNQTAPWVQPWPEVVFTYVQTPMDPPFGDGATTQFQLGDGLSPTTVTAVFAAGVSVAFTANAAGLCTLSAAPAKYARMTGNGTEHTSA